MSLGLDVPLGNILSSITNSKIIIFNKKIIQFYYPGEEKLETQN